MPVRYSSTEVFASASNSLGSSFTDPAGNIFVIKKKERNVKVVQTNDWSFTGTHKKVQCLTWSQTMAKTAGSSHAV